MRVSLTFVVLMLCGSGYAGPCKPKSPTTTALDGTSSVQATVSASTEVDTATGATSVAEPSTTDLSSSITTDINTATTTTIAELSSSIEIPTTTAEATTTTAEEPGPSQLFLNPTFDEPNDDQDYDASPWVLSDSVSPMSVHISDVLGRSGSHSAYWSITSTSQNGKVYQPVNLERSKIYKLSYWWYVDDIQQPQGISDCYIVVEQRSIDGKSATWPSFQQLPTPLPLKTWTKFETSFNSLNIINANIALNVVCSTSAGSGLKIAIDDVSLLNSS
ncbi:hypothetical protein FHETE_8835 [Fusarium heterosporum]|uniref:CBM-cenC domain-containing protein n=1 Tax=Fusarium heterosporum TaxID=42747 RepID=A0A8H5SZT4_FUSHE|nr:hypothetical protein FHETE_8835 [Fusarium heterosporum]